MFEAVFSGLIGGFIIGIVLGLFTNDALDSLLPKKVRKMGVTGACALIGGVIGLVTYLV